MNPNEIRRIFPNASRSFIADNSDHPELFERQGIEGQESRKGNKITAVRPKLERRSGNGSLDTSKTKGRDLRRFFVRVTSIRRGLIDEDNLCEKYVVDCCRYAGLIPGDGPGQTKIEVTQRKAGKEEQEQTIVEIYQLES